MGRGDNSVPCAGRGRRRGRSLHGQSQPRAACTGLNPALVFPGGSCFSCCSAAGCGGGHAAVTFPAVLPTLALRRDSAEPRALPRGALHRPATRAAATHRPRRRTNGWTDGRGGRRFPQSGRGGGGGAAPQMQPLGATNHSAPLLPLSAGPGTAVRPDSGGCAHSRTPEPTPRLPRGVCRLRRTPQTCGPRSCPLAPILPKSILPTHFVIILAPACTSAGTPMHTGAHTYDGISASG